MIHIEKTEEPEFWKSFRSKKPRIRYDDLEKSEEGKQIRQQLRQYNIVEQHGLCGYCCTSITIEESINEHIKPRGVGKYTNLSMNYLNIIACCKGKTSCSAYKGSRYDCDLFISPLDQDCESYFEYSSNGEVASNSPKGQYTIELLNLNSYKLRQARSAQLKVCRDFHSPEIVEKIFLTPDTENLLKPFIDIVKYFHDKNEL